MIGSHSWIRPPPVLGGATRRLGRLVFVGACIVLCGTGWGDPSVPWVPSASSRHDLELLADEAGLDMTLTQWPLPRAAVVRALDALPTMLPPALDAARAEIRRELAGQQRSRLSLTVRGRQEGISGFGDDATLGSSMGVRSSVQGDDRVAVQLGGRIDAQGSEQGGSKFRLDDSAVAIEVAGIQVQAWAHRSWWGPGWQSSLLLGNNAPAFSGFGFQRASASQSESPWLSWLGPWNFEVFVAQTEDATQPANPYIVGQRLTLRPFSNLEIGLTRTAQWGGRGRTQSLKSFFDMLTGTGLNAHTPNQEADDPANEMAGYDMRLRCFGGVPCAFYAQLIGEDQAGLFPSHFLGLYGVESWSADGRQRYFAEYAETGCRSPIGRPFLKPCAYRNYAYPDGYTDAGRWMGASIGPDSRLLTLGWLDAAGGTSLRLNLGRVGSRIGSFTPLIDDPDTAGRVVGVSARRSFQWGQATITPELDAFHIDAPDGSHTVARLGANLQMSLDSAFEATASGLGASLSGADASALQPLLIGAGVVAASALLDRPLGDYAQAHGSNPSARALRAVGDAIPMAGIGLAGVSWALQHGSVQGDVGYAALSAGAAALVATEIGKYAVDRDRPSDGSGPSSFGDGPRGQSSFPSTHAAVAWAVVTPYAKYCDAPWLYGLAAVTNAGRVMSRDHWFSDTVAGSVLGYYLGDWTYRRSGAADDRSKVRLWIAPRAVTLQATFE
jgi:membrane-associated phospholipid phosphatase